MYTLFHIQSMSKILDNNHAELVPPLDDDEECWHLPFLCLLQETRSDRGLFDSSAKFKRVSLNSGLLIGHYLTNDLLREYCFRKEMVSVTVDV